MRLRCHISQGITILWLQAARVPPSSRPPRGLSCRYALGQRAGDPVPRLRRLPRHCDCVRDVLAGRPERWRARFGVGYCTVTWSQVLSPTTDRKMAPVAIMSTAIAASKLISSPGPEPCQAGHNDSILLAFSTHSSNWCGVLDKSNARSHTKVARQEPEPRCWGRDAGILPGFGTNNLSVNSSVKIATCSTSVQQPGRHLAVVADPSRPRGLCTWPLSTALPVVHIEGRSRSWGSLGRILAGRQRSEPRNVAHC